MKFEMKNKKSVILYIVIFPSFVETEQRLETGYLRETSEPILPVIDLREKLRELIKRCVYAKQQTM